MAALPAERDVQVQPERHRRIRRRRQRRPRVARRRPPATRPKTADSWRRNSCRRPSGARRKRNRLGQDRDRLGDAVEERPDRDRGTAARLLVLGRLLVAGPLAVLGAAAGERGVRGQVDQRAAEETGRGRRSPPVSAASSMRSKATAEISTPEPKAITEATTSWGHADEPGDQGADDQRAARQQPPESRLQPGRHRCSSLVGVAQQVPAEVRDGEGDRPALGGVHQALLDQRVPGGGERRRLAAERDGHLRRRRPPRRSGRRARPSRACTRARRGWRGRSGEPKKPTASSASATGAAMATSSAVIGRDGGDVPGDLAVGLHEVGVAVGRLVQGVQRGRRRTRRPPARPGPAARGRPPRGRAGRSAGSGTAARSSSWTPTARRAGGGGPAPTTISGAPCCESSWQAAQIAETSSGCTSCISSMNSAMPLPMSAATPAASLSSSTRSISMSPESARPVAAGTSMPGCQRSRTLASAGRLPQGERLEDAEDLLDRLLVLVPRPELAQRHVQRGGDRPAQRLLGPGLDLAGAPAAGDRRRAELVEQHRLADAAQAGEHQASAPAGRARSAPGRRRTPTARCRARPARAGAGRPRGRTGSARDPCRAPYGVL